MTDNMDLWNKVRRVPPEHLKAFTRGGGFKGTAIKPMWAIETMTEQFGPIGNGWGMDKPEFQLVSAGNEILVYCTVAVWVGAEGDRFYGVGGDKVLVQFSSGLKADDEAFKKAYTDALGNALKFIGVAADIHLGLWDGNKYVESKDEDHGKTAPPAPMPGAVGTTGASKAPNRANYVALAKEIANATGVEALKKAYQSNIAAIEALPPDWVDELRIEYSDRMSELKLKAAA